MREFDEKIRETARAFEFALTAGGRDGRRYEVDIEWIDVRSIESTHDEAVCNITVREVTDRVIAP